MFHQTHRLCPACDNRVPASAVQCSECETKLTPIRRLDSVRVTLALLSLFVLAGGGLWALNTHDPRVPVVAPRNWWAADSLGLAIDSTVEGRLSKDSAEVTDSVLVLTGGRTEECDAYDPGLKTGAADDRSGPVSIANRSGRGILVTIYHPDGEGWSTIRRRVPAGRTVVLTAADGKRVIARSNWGVQVNTYCLELFDRVAGWTGERFTLTWAGEDANQ